MTPTANAAAGAGRSSGVFATTHWSVVLAAGRPDTPQAAEALEQLCGIYWYPLYFYVRRRGYSPEDAQDLTQQFFATLLQSDRLARADPERGRFRSFLLKALEHFVNDDWKRRQRLKRGGGAVGISFDGQSAEQRYACEPVETMTPERAYEQRWAMTLLDKVLGALRVEYSRLGKGRLFDALKELVWGADPSFSYARVAADLGMTEGALRVAVSRLRERYRQRLRGEVAQTVENPAEVEEELRYLLGVVG